MQRLRPIEKKWTPQNLLSVGDIAGRFCFTDYFGYESEENKVYKDN